MKTIVMMYVTMMPVIIAGVANMYFCKSDLLAWAAVPIDGGYSLRGKRFLGDNKTWKGFWGMIACTVLAQAVWGLILGLIPNFLSLSYLASYGNDIFFNFFMGFLLGTAYALCELPNSFIKRRLSIPPGKSGKGYLKWVFLVVDQIDSLIGCTLTLAIFAPMSLLQFLGYLILGGLTHLAVNGLLHHLKVRESRF